MITSANESQPGSKWPTKRLKYVAPAQNDRAEASPSDPDYIGLENVESWTGRFLVADSDVPVDDDAESTGTAARFAVGDVLFGKLRPYLAKAALADRDGVCSTELLVLRADAELEPRFLRYFLLCPNVVALIDSSTFGAKMPRASWNFIGGIRVPIPDRNIQQRIADYLDRETAEIDTLIPEKERMLVLLEEKRAALVTHAVTRGLDPKAKLKPSGLDWLGDVPAHWTTSRLKFLATVKTGLTIGKDYKGQLLDDYYYLRVANVQDGYLSLDDLTTVAVPDSEATSCLLAPGDVLMNEGGDIDKLGRGCVWRGEVSPCLHQNHVFCVRPHTVDSEWLTTFTATKPAKLYFESRAKRTTNLASISSSNIKELTVPLPPSDEQKQIMDILKRCDDRINDVRSSTKHALDLLRERRSALITAAVTGHIPVEAMTL